MFRSLKGLVTGGHADARCAIAVVVALVGERFGLNGLGLVDT